MEGKCDARPAICESAAIKQLITKKEASNLRRAGDRKKAVVASYLVIKLDSDALDSNWLFFASTKRYAAGYIAGKIMARA